MSKMKSLSISLSTAALMAASPAFADITADELWAMWQEQSASFGQPISAEVTNTGNGLILSNVTSATLIEDVTMSTIMDQIVLTNQPDGSVSIEMPGNLNYRITGIDDPDAPSQIDIVFQLTGVSATAAGSTDLLTMDANMARLELADITFEGIDPADVPEFDATMVVSGYSYTSVYDFTDPAFIRLSSTGSTGAVEFAFSAIEPAGNGAAPTPAPVPVPEPVPTTPSKGGPVAPAPQVPAGGNTGGNAAGHFETSLNIGPSQMTVSAALPVGVDWENLQTFPAGLAVEMDGTYESFSVMFAYQDGRNEFLDFAAQNSGGLIGFGLSDQAVRYEMGAQNVSFSAAGSELDFPLGAAADSTLIAIDFPLAREDQPSPFSANLAYEGVTVDESIWAMADPTGAMPHGPATLIMDVSGTVQLFVDILTMDPNQMSAPPGEIRALTLNNLQVSFGGAELTGVGDLDFVPGQIIPVPVGSVDMRMSGANTLIQTLSSAGLLPAQQAGMVRAMLGMFAVPGNAPDTYNSSIEFTAEGGITANGVPLR